MLLTIFVIAIVSLVSLGMISWFVDYYFYSWTANTVRPFGCKYKYIHAKHFADDSKNLLKQDYDLYLIESGLKSNTEYKTESRRKKSLRIARRFGNVIYNIVISKKIKSETEVTKVALTNHSRELYEDSSIKAGEDSKIPNYQIRKNIYLMINEMPLSKAQKKELKSKVEIKCWATWQPTF